MISKCFRFFEQKLIMVKNKLLKILSTFLRTGFNANSFKYKCYMKKKKENKLLYVNILNSIAVHSLQRISQKVIICKTISFIEFHSPLSVFGSVSKFKKVQQRMRIEYEHRHKLIFR